MFERGTEGSSTIWENQTGGRKNMAEAALASSAKNKTEELQMYLKDVYTVEKERYCLERAVSKMEETIKCECVKPSQPQSGPVNMGNGWLYAIGIFGVVSYFTFAFGYSLWDWLHDNYIEMGFLSFSLLAGAIPGGIVAVCFLLRACKRNAFLDECAQSRYEVAMEKYEVTVKELVPVHQATLEDYKRRVASCQQTLAQLYSKDIIFPKYRNLIAVSQFYEYFMSGRCTVLEGHEGAYNLYENEVRQNIIITKLDQALTMLKQIRDTQYMLLDAINSCNTMLAKVADAAAAAAYNSSVVAYNTSAISRW